jgi:8-oxo-dGTP diphosphatase
VAAAVVWRDGRLLLTRRPPEASHPLKWELPGGKIEPRETPEQALVREIDEELGVQARPLETLATHRHLYPNGPRVEIVFVRCTLDALDFHPSPAVHAVRWSRPDELDLEEVLSGDHEFLVTLGALRGR